MLGGDFERRWERVLHDGLLAGQRAGARRAGADRHGAAGRARGVAVRGAAPATAESLELVFQPSAAVYDGRFANNAWLQELPEPVSKLTWDNAALLSTRPTPRRSGSATATW